MYFCMFDVVAETEAEAFEFIKVFEPEFVRKSLKLDECKVIEENWNEYKGVYKTYGNIFFDNKEE